MLANGVIFGIDPIVSQAHGAGDGARAALALQRGVALALGFSIPVALPWLFTEETAVEVVDPGVGGDLLVSPCEGPGTARSPPPGAAGRPTPRWPGPALPEARPASARA